MAGQCMRSKEKRRWKSKCPRYLLTKDESWVLAEVLPLSSSSLIARYHTKEPMKQLDIKEDIGLLDQVVIKEEPSLWNQEKEEDKVTASTDMGSCSMEWVMGIKDNDITYDEEAVDVEANTMSRDDIAMPTEIAELEQFGTADKICSVCSKEFENPSHMKAHMRTHTGEKPFACPFCDKRFSLKGSLKSHITVHTGEQAYNKKVYPKYGCKYCGKKFSASNMKTHMRTHTGEKPFVCSYCGRGFSEKSSLTSHIRQRTGEKCPWEKVKHTCDVCSKELTSSSLLATHMRTHTGEKPFVCSCCGKGFSQKGNLKSHEVKIHRMHTDKVCSCHQCDKIFATESELKIHLLVHRSDKPFVCLTCGNAFKGKRGLKGHIRTFHGKEDNVTIKGEDVTVKEEEYLVLN